MKDCDDSLQGGPPAEEIQSNVEAVVSHVIAKVPSFGSNNFSACV